MKQNDENQLVRSGEIEWQPLIVFLKAPREVEIIKPRK